MGTCHICPRGETAYAVDLKSIVERHEGSNPSGGTYDFNQSKSIVWRLLVSISYDEYLKKHRAGVASAKDFMLANFSEELNSILPELNTEVLNMLITHHDLTKYSPDEYGAYDRYFYRNDDSEDIQKEFDQAWLHHIRCNPHHWQHWVLIEDDSDSQEKLKPLPIPDNYILEMICDWWSFSWVKFFSEQDDEPNESSFTSYDYLQKSFDNLYSIFDWYADHKDKIVVTNEVREKIEAILDLIQNKLDSINGGNYDQVAY